MGLFACMRSLLCNPTRLKSASSVTDPIRHVTVDCTRSTFDHIWSGAVAGLARTVVLFTCLVCLFQALPFRKPAVGYRGCRNLVPPPPPPSAKNRKAMKSSRSRSEFTSHTSPTASSTFSIISAQVSGSGRFFSFFSAPFSSKGNVCHAR